MEQIAQLKTMRDDALERLNNNADFRLMTSLDNLIGELEEIVTTPRPSLSVVEPVKSTEEEVEEVLGQINAELDDAEDDEDDFDLDDEDNKISFN